MSGELTKNYEDFSKDKLGNCRSKEQFSQDNAGCSQSKETIRLQNCILEEEIEQLELEDKPIQFQKKSSFSSSIKRTFRYRKHKHDINEYLSAPRKFSLDASANRPGESLLTEKQPTSERKSLKASFKKRFR